MEEKQIQLEIKEEEIRRDERDRIVSKVIDLIREFEIKIANEIGEKGQRYGIQRFIKILMKKASEEIEDVITKIGELSK